MLYALTFGGDPLTLGTLSPGDADRAVEALDAWWRHNQRWAGSSRASGSTRR